MTIKRIEDYLDQIQELYPNVPKSDLKKILNFGWKSLYLHNSYGGDVVIKDQNFFAYFGRLMNNSLSWFAYYKKKLATKILILFKRHQKGCSFDGYYYFALTPPQLKDYYSQQKGRGRKRSYYTFKNIILYKCKEECIVREAEKPYLFRVRIVADIGWHIFKREFKTKYAEFITERSNKLKDILVTNNNYEYV